MPMKNLALTLITGIFLVAAPVVSFAETALIGSELAVIEGPPDLVRELRESFAQQRPRKKTTGKSKRVAAAKKAAPEQESEL